MPHEASKRILLCLCRGCSSPPLPFPGHPQPDKRGRVPWPPAPQRPGAGVHRGERERVAGGAVGRAAATRRRRGEVGPTKQWANPSTPNSTRIRTGRGLFSSLSKGAMYKAVSCPCPRFAKAHHAGHPNTALSTCEHKHPFHTHYILSYSYQYAAPSLCGICRVSPRPHGETGEALWHTPLHSHNHLSILWDHIAAPNK